MNITRSKVRGMVVGGAIGDALGLAVETWTPERIVEVHGGPITGYVDPIGHKWYKPENWVRGKTSDDTQLDTATMRGFILGHPKVLETKTFDPYMDAITSEHIKAANETIDGWGKTTVEAVRRLANGVHWKLSGKTVEENRGTGNGVPMKINSFGAWIAVLDCKNPDLKDFLINQSVIDYSAMTHYSKISAHASIIHSSVMHFCLEHDSEYLLKNERFFKTNFLSLVSDDYRPEYLTNLPNHHMRYDDSHLDSSEDNIFDRMEFLKDNNVYKLYDKPLSELTVPQIREMFGGGSCYVYDSLPFAYAFFLRNPKSASAILETVNAGGDTDTNAKIVGSMIGAIHGLEIFFTKENYWMIKGLPEYDELITLADQFCDCFGIKDGSNN